MSNEVSVEDIIGKQVRIRGKVVNFRNGWGFLAVDGWKKQVFVHWTQIVSDDEYKQLDPGDIVEFELGKHNDKIQANKVVRVDAGM